MSALSITGIAGLAEVKSAVVGDPAGALVDAFREPDGESVAAVTGVVCEAVARVGELLGLGAQRRLSYSGASRACLVAMLGDKVLTAFVEPATALVSVEKALDTSLKQRV
jgi:predicted regulator of Ras-like GTPase activity (Roadblock/LC7/MglB family)